MKVIKLFAILFLFTFGPSAATGQKTLPEVTLKTLDGEKVALQQYVGSGKPVIISMWATWCAPCKKELDAISLVYDEWQKIYQVELIAITIDTHRQLAKVKPMVQSKQWKYTILSDADNQLRSSLGVMSIPQTYLLNGKGEIIYSHTGYSPGDEDKLKKRLEKIVAQ